MFELFEVPWSLGRIENQKIWILSIPQVGPMDAHKSKHIYILRYFFRSKTALENDKTCFLNPPLFDFFFFLIVIKSRFIAFKMTAQITKTQQKVKNGKKLNGDRKLGKKRPKFPQNGRTVKF